MWFKKNKWKVLLPTLVIAVLVAAFFFGGNAPDSIGWGISKMPLTASESSQMGTRQPTEIPSEISVPGPTKTVETTDKSDKTAELTSEPIETPISTSNPDAEQIPTPEPTMVINPETGKDQYITEDVQAGKPVPVERQDTTIGETAYTCTISIFCATILDNIDFCNQEKTELVPADGWILQPVTVTFYEGESVFNVLQRVCKQNKIHMEFENTPIYESAYVNGIQNLYEFDVGELSGWMYMVNEWFPNYGCSRYQLKNGDIICWVYTCNMGYDVGGRNTVGG